MAARAIRRAGDPSRGWSGTTQLEITSEGENQRVRRLVFVGAGNGPYDALGNPTSIRDASGKIQYLTYDPIFSLPLTILDPAGNSSSFQYDSRGNLIMSRNAQNNATHYEYNGRGQLTRVTDPLSRVTQFTYDPSGHLVQVRDPIGNGSFTDFHCLRLDKDGRWSHKDGAGPVRRHDDTKNDIIDLRTALFKLPLTFVGFFLSTKGRRRIT